MLTLVFFVILIVLSYGADRCGSMYAEKEEDIEELKMKESKSKLRRIAD